MTYKLVPVHQIWASIYFDLMRFSQLNDVESWKNY